MTQRNKTINSLILDLETTTTIHLGRKASPFAQDNWIVAGGFQVNNSAPTGDYYTEPINIDLPDLTDIDVIVGHNLKFDLLYLWEYPEIKAYLKRGGKIWCTQYAEYLLMGMLPDSHMNSLNDCAVKYGGNTKIDAVKDMWNAGINTPDIPKDLLMDYLLGTPEMEGDIGNTYRVYQGQLEAIKDRPAAFSTMLNNRMDSLLATTECEYNGLYVNQEIGEDRREELFNTVETLTADLSQYIPDLPPEAEFKWTSIYDKSYLIYGGVKKYLKWVHHEEDGKKLYAQSIEKWPLFSGSPMAPELCVLDDDFLYRWDNNVQDTFKSGQRVGEGKTRNTKVDDHSRPKGAKTAHFFTFEGYTQPSPKWESECNGGDGAPIYSTASSVIEELAKRDIPFLQDLALRGKYAKDLGTYYWAEKANGKRSGMLTRVGDDGIIHHSLNHTSTVTSRMSSSNPNLQNLPRKGTSQVKQMFESRWGDDGIIIEMDYSALEVYVQAVLCNELNMQSQIRDGIDFHCFRLSVKLGQNYDDVFMKCKDETHPDHKWYDDQRTKVKGFSFQLAYGAGAPAIADSIGMPVDEVKELMALEAMNYPALAEFDTMLENAIIDSYLPTSKMLFINGRAFNIGTGYWDSPTGTRYCWSEGQTPEFLWARGKYVGFSPTERKNYPIQGFGGEIMQTMLGLLWRWMIKQDHFDGKALLINTVHDSVYLDIHKSVVHDVVPSALKILSAVKYKFNKDFNLGINIDFKVDAAIGQSMYKTHGYNPNEHY